MHSLPPGYSLHAQTGLDSLSSRTLHGIAQLRQRVFVVEQACAYLDLDGKDAEPRTWHYWVTPDSQPSQVVATLRVLDEGDREPHRHAIGRVATAAEHRGRGLARALMDAVIADHGSGPLTLEAQSHLTDWYGRFGFAVSGTPYLEDGIPHTPMRRA